MGAGFLAPRFAGRSAPWPLWLGCRIGTCKTPRTLAGRGKVANGFETDQKAAVTEATTLEPAIVLPFLVEEKFGCR